MIPVCHIDDIPDDSSRSFTHKDQAVFGIKKNQGVYFYANQCPHLGLPLEWQANQFLSSDKSLIQCASHGALFEITSGECIAGPCHGQSLIALDIEIKDGFIYIQ